MVSPKQVKNAEKFPKANLVGQSSDGELVFMQKTQTENYLVGYADGGIEIVYTDPVLFMRRPLRYGEVIADTYAVRYTARGFEFEGKGTIRVEVDGEGRLILPNGTYDNVLRVKITQSQTDVMLKYPSKIQTTTVTYVWFDPAHRGPSFG